MVLDRRYNLPMIITENGLGAIAKLEEDGTVHDQYRIDYVKAHIDELKEKHKKRIRLTALDILCGVL